MDIEKAKNILIELSTFDYVKLENGDEAIETVLNELEKKDNKIKELESRCRNLDKEAQSYFEELMGDSTLKNRTIKQLNLELEKKEAEIDKLRNSNKDLLRNQGLD